MVCFLLLVKQWEKIVLLYWFTPKWKHQPHSLENHILAALISRLEKQNSSHFIGLVNWILYFYFLLLFQPDSTLPHTSLPNLLQKQGEIWKA